MSTFVVSSLLGEFTTITLGPSAREVPRMISGRPTGGGPVRFEWGGSKAATVETALRAVGVPSNALVNGQPDRAMNGRSYAQTLSSGFLVNLAYRYLNGPSINEAGLLVVLDSQVGPDSPLRHSLQVVFYPMEPGSRLYDVAGEFTEVPE